jgi:farnesyl diphosphate synthase
MSHFTSIFSTFCTKYVIFPHYLLSHDPLQQVSYQTEMGQLVDLITAPEGRVDLSKFSLDRCGLLPYLLSSQLFILR